MTLVEFHTVEEQEGACSLRLAAEEQGVSKLPFDLNDYCTFELNEDFINSSATFVNGYRGESGYSTYCEYGQHDSLSSQLRVEIENQLDNDYSYHYTEPPTPNCVNEQEYDIYFEDVNVLDDDSGQLDANSTDDDQYNYAQALDCLPPVSFPDFLTAALTSDRQYANQTNGFKIFDISHRDFQCAVITRQGTPCKNRVTCSFHNSTDKSLIPRSDSLEHLMRNYKYLQELHQTAYEGTRLKKRPLEQDSTIMRNEQMKRHNSYSNQGSGVQPRVTESVVETFITALHGKLQQVKEDEDERLCEFHYKLELKNFAIVEYYKGQLL
ncbi:uncharacterized protein CYBJADRAFT_192287 [Cyberlindnera jadinii NRRL Y-1542]|uniref:SCA7 domain-containing protein n=1 Tax=Cyberlindnera jadinii (strain ATCC 18201 / CBS 1600 / BCRC 20928 / JCM 3617 / NBRC 0987 / NRRL Y-1542) TaxID=983966 RepID=A0A1E4RUQ8_CYBJN|nr:hypothetical protein CYBJADRAFT_192287 [Cyberlindnera jadinii NRRL Y-1542]ODV70986.1 hypothetical protein CYBJADRAFT_192287 [Cyberlindnera jadinii NRRL Y-1542]